RRVISIDEFRKIELKVATIKAAEPHPNADKLMVLQVDLGSEQRQICAGIRNHYAPEQLIGRQIVVVANLETAKLRGLESQGMLLAASDEERLILLTPEKAVQPGSKVSSFFISKSIHGYHSGGTPYRLFRRSQCPGLELSPDPRQDRTPSQGPLYGQGKRLRPRRDGHC